MRALEKQAAGLDHAISRLRVALASRLMPRVAFDLRINGDEVAREKLARLLIPANGDRP